MKQKRTYRKNPNRKHPEQKEPLKKIYPNCQYTTHGQLAAAVGITAGQVSNILRGHRRPSLPVALKMAELLNVPVDTLNRGDARANN